MDSLACPECGGPLEPFQEGLSGGARCPLCRWSVVTTVLPGILRDRTRYEVHVLGADPGNHAQLRALAGVLGQDLVQVRRGLGGASSFVAFSGSATEVSRVRDTFRGCGLHFEIRPDYPW